jgi:hypothetical protein
MSKSVKFGIIAAVMFPALILLSSCENPQSMRLKASPTLQIPIPLGDGTNSSLIRDYTDPDKIREKFNEGADQRKLVAVYGYSTDSAFMTSIGISTAEDPARTYLITFPLFDMNLDLTEYINGLDDDDIASKIPAVDISPEIVNTVNSYVNYGGIVPENLIDDAVVDLGDMKSLLSNLAFKTGGAVFRLPVNAGNAQMLKNAVRIKIPELKIGEFSWIAGTIDNPDNPQWLEFKTDTTIAQGDILLLKPGQPETERVTIKIKLVDRVAAGSYQPELDLNWHSVEVSPGGTGVSSGKIEGFNLQSYLADLGEPEFHSVPAYLYLNTPANVGTLEITISAIKNDGFSTPIDLTAPPGMAAIDKVKIQGDAPPWLDTSTSVEDYDFEGILNEGNAAINYKVEQKSGTTVTLYSNTAGTSKITANLALLLPMVFDFPSADVVGGPTAINDDVNTAGINEAGNYIPLKFAGLDDFLGETDDDGVLAEINKELGDDSGVNNIRLTLSGINNTLTSPIYLGIPKVKGTPTADDWELVTIDPAPGGTPEASRVIYLPPDADGKLSIPKLKFFLKEETLETTPSLKEGGRLYFKDVPQADEAFSIKISVVADIALDKEIDF